MGAARKSSLVKQAFAPAAQCSPDHLDPVVVPLLKVGQEHNGGPGPRHEQRQHPQDAQGMSDETLTIIIRLLSDSD